MIKDEIIKYMYDTLQYTADGFVPEEKLTDHFKLSFTHIYPYIQTLEEEGIVEVEKASLRNRTFWRFKLTALGKSKYKSNFIDTNSISTDKYERAVFVSYAWGGESENMVDGLETAFTKRNIRVVRDKKELGYKGSIEEFEKRIGRGQCIILVISDKYLRSEHCMFELVEIEENKEFRKRIFPIVLEDARIYKVIDRLDYINYWEDQIEKLNQAIKQVNRLTNLAGITANLDKFARIRSKFDHLVDLLSDMNALTPEIHTTSGYTKLIGNIETMLSNGMSED